MLKTTLSIIGAGNMASAILEGILGKKLIMPDCVMVTNRSVGKLEKLRARWPIRTSYNNEEAARYGHVIILSVKPSDMPIACEQISRGIARDELVISVAAGIRIQTLKKWLGCPDQPIIRVMPNTPSQIGHGISGWSASQEVTPSQIDLVQQLLGVLGLEIGFPDEDSLDRVTAISGSGPAYIFYIAEVLTESAQAIGLKEAEAKELVSQTIYGAAAMLHANGKAPAELRAAVTSKGGTTEAALHEFIQGGLDRIIRQGVQAAYDRGREIGVQWASK